MMRSSVSGAVTSNISRPDEADDVGDDTSAGVVAGEPGLKGSETVAANEDTKSVPKDMSSGAEDGDVERREGERKGDCGRVGPKTDWAGLMGSGAGGEMRRVCSSAASAVLRWRFEVGASAEESGRLRERVSGTDAGCEEGWCCGGCVKMVIAGEDWDILG